MSTHRLDIFWRDVEARCFTTLYFQVASQTQAQTRCQHTLAALSHLSRLQIYGAALDTQPLALTPDKAAPSNGTETRLEIELFPSEPLKPQTGIEYIKFSIPGPTSELAQAVTANQVHSQVHSPEWQLLEEEILPFLCLTNGTQVQTPLQIKRSEAVQLSEERRPQPTRAPLSAAISATANKVDGLKQRLAHQPTARLHASLVKNQARLAHLLALASIEELFFSTATRQPVATQPAAARQAEAIRAIVAKQTITEEASFMVDKETPVEAAHLPIQTTSEEWKDVPKEDFFSTALWLHRNQLKEIYGIPQERAYFRWLEKLRQNGLSRSLPAKDNRKVVLFYRPDVERALAKVARQATKIHRGRPPKIGLPEPPQPPPQTTPQSRPEAPATIPALELAQIWAALSEIKSAQASLQAQHEALSARLDSLSSTVNSLPKAQEQFVEVVNFHQLNSQLSRLLHRMDSRLKQLGGQATKTAKAKTKRKAQGKTKTRKTAGGRKPSSTARKP